MAMIWRKPPDTKYTELCIFIDENIEKIRVPGADKQLEDKIWNYLFLLVKALAIKKGMFPNFNDYDPYAFYAANRLFFALRKNLENQGKVIKGKLIRPIKSCLNYTKALLYPMKIEYQREAYKEIINEEFTSKKFDAFSFKEHLKADAAAIQPERTMLPLYIADTIADLDTYLNKVLTRLPFTTDSVEYSNIKISILLNCLMNLKTKGKLNTDPQTILLWKLPKSMVNYIRVLLKEFYTEFANELMNCCTEARIDDSILESILTSNEGAEYIEND